MRFCEDLHCSLAIVVLELREVTGQFFLDKLSLVWHEKDSTQTCFCYDNTNQVHLFIRHQDGGLIEVGYC